MNEIILYKLTASHRGPKLEYEVEIILKDGLVLAKIREKNVNINFFRIKIKETFVHPKDVLFYKKIISLMEYEMRKNNFDNLLND